MTALRKHLSLAQVQSNEKILFQQNVLQVDDLTWTSRFKRQKSDLSKAAVSQQND